MVEAGEGGRGWVVGGGVHELVRRRRGSGEGRRGVEGGVAAAVDEVAIRRLALAAGLEGERNADI